MEIIRRRNYRPETQRLIEQRNAKTRPRTLRRREHPQTQRMVFDLSRSNKRSREGITEMDAELMKRANRLGGTYETKNQENTKLKNKRQRLLHPSGIDLQRSIIVLKIFIP